MGFNYSDIFLSPIYTAFCGGNVTEVFNYVRKNTLQHLKKISIPSFDSILRGDVVLAVPCENIETPSRKANKTYNTLYLLYGIDWNINDERKNCFVFFMPDNIIVESHL